MTRRMPARFIFQTSLSIMNLEKYSTILMIIYVVLNNVVFFFNYEGFIM